MTTLVNKRVLADYYIALCKGHMPSRDYELLVQALFAYGQGKVDRKTSERVVLLLARNTSQELYCLLHRFFSVGL